ncbi:RabGAP/TBC [Yamadazyma tenuis ATCC 10573]|uniref:RabGAP/TBC n=1 Tax=Candida tenuis (strain ATCC 10573 / BCRC 21748 / CBS 615 / JCM 9827 / NBRC 10315 / NRRL Y-1498 / VKM Y-70) TaxID=590646 RepID=G3BEE6_CANTC|nr:RabGAP/TBC [Yamadazyma tenuis ATCC 10573]EGV60527.1 RabGAP/TBC [Yamadazyma tenuis ATCC 10573]
MGKKKQEMSQVYNSNNEFIFGEKGGKGKNLSTFLKNLSLTTSPSQPQSEFNEANSNIYGSLSYSNPNTNEISRSNPSLARRASPKRSLSGPTNMSFAHSLTPTASEALRTNSPTRTKRVVSAKYADLDDDWDANFDDARVDTDMPSVRREGFGNTFLDPSPMLDSLYPDLTIPAGTKEPVKDSIDLEDMKIKLEINKLNQLNTKFLKFKALLTQSSNINLQELRKLSWNGIPSNLRAISWQILLGYLPTNKSRQSATLKIKRQEYLDGINSSSLNLNRDKQIYHQIKIDVKRTNPTVKLYGHPEVQKSLRKILYFWAIRHPASGYVQGINDLVTPFFQIFLTNYIWQLQPLLNDPQLFNYNLHNLDPTQISSRVLSIIEADTYWCLSRLLETITDNYIHQQPGILKQVSDLKNLISKIDIDLIHHFEQENIEFLQFAFRWMNCLLMRELSIDLIIRMWDTYLSESPLGFSNFHIYVCAAFLIKFSSDLKQKDFQEIILFLQNPPTSHWTDKDIELMLSEAFIWSSLYKNASAHLR